MVPFFDVPILFFPHQRLDFMYLVFRIVLVKKILPAWCYFDGMGRPGWTGVLRFTGGLPLFRSKCYYLNYEI